MIRLRIKQHGDSHVCCEAVDGITHYGFGTFLENIQAHQIECDAFSKNALLTASFLRDLAGLEIWRDNRIAWGSPALSILMPIDCISKQDGADEWIEQIVVSD